MAQAGVGPQATLLGSSYSKGFSLRNGGPGVVYLGDDSSLTPGSSSWKLAMGESITWDAGRKLFVCTDAGQQSTLYYLEGLAGATATNVTVTGKVTTTPDGTPQPIFGTVGASPRNGVTLLDTVTRTYASGFVGSLTFFNNTVQYDVSQYASIIVEVINQSNTDALSIATNNRVTCDIYQTNGVAPNATKDHAEWFFGTTIQQTFQVPVVGHFMSVNVGAGTPGSTDRSGTVIVNVYGSNEVIENKRYANDFAGSAISYGLLAQSGAYADTLTSPDANTLIKTPPIASKSGPAVFNVAKTGGAGATVVGDLLAFTNGTAMTLAQIRVTPNETPYGRANDVILPSLPLAVRFTNTTAASTLAISLTA